MSDRIMWLDRVTSTQDVTHELAAAGAEDGEAVVAVEQTAGRGSRGRAWASGRGGLWLSVLCRPTAAAPPEALSIRVALAVAAALEAAGAADIMVKWPNDLMISGRKVGGILAEARWVGDRLGWIAIGVGINVANTLPDELRDAAATVGDRLPGARASDLAPAIIAAVRAAGSVAGPLDPAEQGDFARRDAIVGRRLVAPVAGVAAGIAADGALRVRRDDGVVEQVKVGPAVAVSL